jgi:hypothetical protein
MVVVARPAGVADDVDREQGPRSPARPRPSRRSPRGIGGAARSGVRRGTLRYTPLHLSARSGG